MAFFPLSRGSKRVRRTCLAETLSKSTSTSSSVLTSQFFHVQSTTQKSESADNSETINGTLLTSLESLLGA